MAVVSIVNGERVHDRRCPECDCFKAMPNPIEHTRDKHPFLCLQCGRSFNAPAETE